MTVQREQCTACGRTVYERGRARLIEAARTVEGEEPVEEYLASLGKNVRRESEIAMVFSEYARLGILRVPEGLNHLRDRLSEIKVGDTRLPFYEFPDAAHRTVVTRLTHGFNKKMQRTGEPQILHGLWVIRQDQQWIRPQEEEAENA